MLHLTIYTRTDGSTAYATIEANDRGQPLFKCHDTEEQAQQHAEELSERLGQGIARIITAADPED
jgi:predicted NBD/HSP70 family sugar kinase